MSTLPSRERRATLAAGLGALALMAGCSERGRFFALPGSAAMAFAGQSMGSSYTVKIGGVTLSDATLRAAQQAVADALQDVVQRMSHYEPQSELAQLNRQALGEPLAVSAPLMQVLQVAQAVRTASDGAFDVSIGRAVDAWGFGPSERPRQPLAPQTVQALRQAASADALALSPATGMVTRRADVLANLSGIAKGYGVDRAAAALDALGLADYMVEVGGEIRTRGRNAQGQPWQLAVERPDAMPQQALYIVPLSGRSLATSGDYRNFFMHEGRRYTHEIDPASAAPVRHALASVSVVADDCTLADAWSTALFVRGPEEGLALARRHQLAAYFVLRQPDGRFTEFATPAFAALGGHTLATA